MPMFNQYIATCTTRIFNVLFNCQINETRENNACDYLFLFGSSCFSCILIKVQ